MKSQPYNPLTIGVIGGMGPYATLDFMEKLIHSTPAAIDQEHLHVIVDMNPNVPDRQDAILRSAESPLPILCKMAEGLKKVGADFIVMPCNTAHYYLDRIRDSVNISIVDMPKVVTDYTLQHYPNLKSVGLLAASGSIKARLYQQHFQVAEVYVLTPDERQQGILMDQIALIKAGNKDERVARRVFEVAETLVESSAEVIVLGCTELPLIKYYDEGKFPVIDGNRALAEHTVKIAYGEISLEK